MINSHGGRKSKDADVNLLPMIDILAVCITFLLTAVSLNVTTFDVNQALGTEASQQSDKETPTLWVEFQGANAAKFEVKIGARVTARSLSKNPTVDVDQITQNYRRQNPDLKTAMVLPSASAKYEDLIKVMDSLKKNEIKDIGIAPL